MAAAEATARTEKKLKGEIEINFIDNQEMRRLNLRWRRRDRPTDVLAFAWGESKNAGPQGATCGGEGNFLGQIFIAYPWAVRQAKERGQTTAKELVRLLVHGLLHVAGLDHARPAEAKKMFTRQERIISKICSR